MRSPSDGDSRPLLRTKCGERGHAFRIRPSLAMLCGHNSGHVTCPGCNQFLHVEILEGDEAWTESWPQYLARHGIEPSSIPRFIATERSP